MSFQRAHQSRSQNPQSSWSTSQLAPRPFSFQEPKRSPTQEELENQTFQQDKFEATGLQLKQQYGTITPVEQEKLGVLQAKMDSFWTQRVERAKTQPNLPAILTRTAQSAQATEPTAPIQPKLAIGKPTDQYEQEADQVAKQVVQQINRPQMLSQPLSPVAQQSGHPSIQRMLVNIKKKPHSTEDEAGRQVISAEIVSQKMGGGDEAAADWWARQIRSAHKNGHLELDKGVEGVKELSNAFFKNAPQVQEALQQCFPALGAQPEEKGVAEQHNTQSEVVEVVENVKEKEKPAESEVPEEDWSEAVLSNANPELKQRWEKIVGGGQINVQDAKPDDLGVVKQAILSLSESRIEIIQIIMDLAAEGMEKSVGHDRPLKSISLLPPGGIKTGTEATEAMGVTYEQSIDLAPYDDKQIKSAGEVGGTSIHEMTHWVSYGMYGKRSAGDPNPPWKTEAMTSWAEKNQRKSPVGRKYDAGKESEINESRKVIAEKAFACIYSMQNPQVRNMFGLASMDAFEKLSKVAIYKMNGTHLSEILTHLVQVLRMLELDSGEDKEALTVIAALTGKKPVAQLEGIAEIFNQFMKDLKGYAKTVKARRRRDDARNSMGESFDIRFWQGENEG